MLQVGDLVPDFELPNQDGEIVKLSDYRGQKVVIFAFPKASTPGCTTQACSFRDALPDMTNANAVVFGISSDNQEDLQKFKREQNLTYDLLSDVDHKVLEAWDAWGMGIGPIKMPVANRSYWAIDEEGRILDSKVGIGPEESMKAALAAVNAPVKND
ncbi:peroxiredoxin [Phototrophicus methaneseepsis]|uniref:thioredoxin-dependent peroxiredoxin n=1 Tax=Phototrophicus methaneseepsis TaxID=2710758 RepID=A0A7S8E8M6_9CHLR|nr:peroxiredoxin [Phototrophicus methaneseepsis]QPC82367.1 peroxiredoxin [Phototrophicus methaneseepsis]